MATIRPAVPNDAEDICRVHVASIRELGRDYYSEKAVEAWASYPDPETYSLGGDAPDEHFVVAERDDEIAGFAKLALDVPEVDQVYVHPEHVRSGVGSALLSHLEDVAGANDVGSLSVEASRNAVPFYRSAGYERIGEREKTLATDTETIGFGVVDMEKQL